MKLVEYNEMDLVRIYQEHQRLFLLNQFGISKRGCYTCNFVIMERYGPQLWSYSR
jgi:hypothetical protein